MFLFCAMEVPVLVATIEHASDKHYQILCFWSVCCFVFLFKMLTEILLGWSNRDFKNFYLVTFYKVGRVEKFSALPSLVHKLGLNLFYSLSVLQLFTSYLRRKFFFFLMVIKRRERICDLSLCVVLPSLWLALVNRVDSITKLPSLSRLLITSCFVWRENSLWLMSFLNLLLY